MNPKISSSVAVHRRFLAFALAFSVAGLSPAGAQLVVSNSAVGVSRRISTDTRAVDSGNSIARSSDAVPSTVLRVVAATGAGAVGLFLGASLGASMEGPCSCDDPGLEGAIIGGLSGIILGSSLGAAAPGLGSSCTLNERFARTLLGSVLGTVAGIVATEASHQIVTLPLFAVGGSVASLGRCMRGTVSAAALRTSPQ